MDRSIASTPFVPSRSPLRWRMLALVWGLYASFGITIGSIPPLVEPILDDLDMSYGQMGLVLGAWQLIYIGTAAPLGRLIDRLGIRRSLGIGITVIFLSLVLRGLAVDFYTLFLTVALFGFGGPIISIGAPKLVAVWFEGNQRGIAAGIYATGSTSGTAIALATAGTVVMPLTDTWRGVSLVYGAIVLVVLVSWWAFSREPPAQSSETEGASSPSSGAARGVFRDLIRLRNVQLILLLAVFVHLFHHGLTSWMPTLLQESGLTLSRAGVWTAIATGISITGLLLIPGIARRGYRALFLAGLLAAAAGASVGLAYLGGAGLFGVLLVSAMVRTPMVPMLMLILMDTPGVGARRMGAAGGLFYTAGEVGGFSGPLLLGLLRDATDSLATGVLTLAVVSACLVLVLPFIRERGAQERRS